MRPPVPVVRPSGRPAASPDSSDTNAIDVIELTALSLLPLWSRRDAADRLRAGVPAGAIARAAMARAGDAGTGLSDLRSRAQAALDRGARAGLLTVRWSDPAYPRMLAAVADPPPLLWLRGAAAALEPPAVAIVGSRAGSAYALAVAERLAGDLAAAGVVVVSGLARGVDSSAHRGALAARGLTVAVLGSGADVVYPAEHRELACAIAASGAVVSELAPGTPPRPAFFPMRNRIISGLVRAVVVVEAGEKSGSLITARLALDQGRDVLAVPGSVLNGRNRGGHALLRDGARIVESADDILEELGLCRVCGRAPADPAAADGAPGGQPADPVLASLEPGEPADLDAIAARSGLPAPRLLARLFDLELRGLVRRTGGGRFARVDRSC